MSSCFIDRLSDDVLCMIFKLVDEEDQAAYHDHFHKKLNSMHWDDWGDNEDYYDILTAKDSKFPASTLISMEAVCEHWKSLLSEMPSLWSVLQVSFCEGAASLERVRTFLQRSGTHPLKITLLWDDLSWVDPVKIEDTFPIEGEPPSHTEMMNGIHLVFLVQELYAHVHRWREFTLRTTSVTHTYHALAIISRPSVHPASMLEKLHLQLVHNKKHTTHYIHEPTLFPGSAPPIRDLLLFGINCAWLSSSMLSSYLVNLRMHYEHGDPLHIVDYGDTIPVGLSRLSGELANLQSLSLELELERDLDIPASEFDAIHPIALPQLRSLTIKSRSMAGWAVDFLRKANMPSLRILTLDGVEAFGLDAFLYPEGVIQELVRLTDPDIMKHSSNCLLELDELHFLSFSHYMDAALVHRMYKQMTTVKILTLGPGARDQNVALVKGLLPTPNGLADLPLPGLQTLIVFELPERLMRRVVRTRSLVAGPLEELYYCTDEYQGENGWQVKKYHRIGGVESYRYCDIVGRQWRLL